MKQKQSGFKGMPTAGNHYETVKGKGVSFMENQVDGMEKLPNPKT